MPNEKQSFKELLSGAPLAVNEESITLSGALERSQNPDRFVLVLANGRTVVLDVSAVKAYRVIGGMIGQMIVEVDVAHDQVPHEIKEDSTRFVKPPRLEKASWEEPPPSFHPGGGWGVTDPVPVPWFRFFSPRIPKNLWEERFHPGGGWGVTDPVPLPWFYNSPYAGITPFALATHHQAPPNAVAAMANMAIPALHASYGNVSHPSWEGTRPGFPYGDF